MKSPHFIAFLLLVIGGVNMLVHTVFDWGLSDLLSGSLYSIFSVLVGLSAIYEIATHAKRCEECKAMKAKKGVA